LARVVAAASNFIKRSNAAVFPALHRAVRGVPKAAPAPAFDASYHQDQQESICKVCQLNRLTFEPPSLYCFGCGMRIKRNQVGSACAAGRRFRRLRCAAAGSGCLSGDAWLVRERILAVRAGYAGRAGWMVPLPASCWAAAIGAAHLAYLDSRACFCTLPCRAAGVLRHLAAA
jgi:hypothetical protein